jgi:hypothetical protein
MHGKRDKSASATGDWRVGTHGEETTPGRSWARLNDHAFPLQGQRVVTST